MPLQDIFENHYKYKAKQSHFDKENEETIEISCDVLVICDAGELIVRLTSTIYSIGEISNLIAKIFQYQYIILYYSMYILDTN